MKAVIVKSHHEMLCPRLGREAQALAAEGHEVTILAWDRDCCSPEAEHRDNYQIHRFRFKAPYGPRMLPLLLIWWFFEFWWLLKEDLDVIQAAELDTILPALVAAAIRRRPVIYELSDIYEDQVPLPRILRKALLYIDKILMRLVDVVTIADEARIKELNGIPNRNVMVIYFNSPADLLKGTDTSLRQGDAFTIFYAGQLCRKRQLNLDTVIMAITGTDNVNLIIAGYGDLVEEIREWSDKLPDKVQFIGQISHPEVLERTMTADLLIALHDPTLLTNQFGIPNKLFEAMMCRKPILVSKGTVAAEIVEKENCGLVVDSSSTEEIKEAIIRLKESPELCQLLAANGRRTYEQRYNWEIGRQRLVNLYNEMSNKM